MSVIAITESHLLQCQYQPISDAHTCVLIFAVMNSNRLFFEMLSLHLFMLKKSLAFLGLALQTV